MKTAQAPKIAKFGRQLVDLKVRMPRKTMARLRALASVRGLSAERVVAMALRLYERRLYYVLS